MELRERLDREFGTTVATRDATAVDAVEGVAPQVVAAPRTAEAAASLVAWCGREGIAFVPRGGGTKLHRGAPPHRCELVLSTEYLDDLIEHDAGNATVIAGAGITLHALNAAVATAGQFVPLDDAFQYSSDNSSGATLGGATATDDSGMSRFKYGAPRDLVIGLHAALTDGRYVKAGAKVVKNVSGYDLNKLFVGSCGTLGLITQVTLRLRPLDAAHATWRSTFNSWQEAIEAAQFVLDGAFEPTSLRVTSHQQEWHLRAHFDGGEASVAAQQQRLQARFEAASEESTAPRPTERDAALQLRARLPLRQAPAWAARAQEAGASQVFWDCSLGVVRAIFADAPWPDAANTVVTLRAAATAEDGFVVVEQAPHEWKTAELVWGQPRADWVLMQRLKQRFDRAGVAAPGRFFGGL